MKRFYLSVLAAFVLLAVQQTTAQNTVVNQVIVCSGGNFSDPDDFVSVAAFKPQDGSTTAFGTVFTQSVQDVVVDGIFAYVAAQDSIVKFNIDSYQRVAAVEAVGVHKLAIAGDKLIASFWYPVTEDFVRIFSKEDLSQQAAISEVSDEADGILVYNNRAYVAVPGGWASAGGKIAVINLTGNLLIEEIDLDSAGVGISDLFLFQQDGDFLVSVNKTPWDATTGYLTKMDLSNRQTTSFVFDLSVGNGIEVYGGKLYLMLNGGIGSIDIAGMTVTDTAVVANTGNGFAAAVFDTLNMLFYATTTDYATTGEGYIYNATGELTGNFDAGIAAEALAVDYRDNTGIFEARHSLRLTVYPNPASRFVRFNIPAEQKAVKILMVNLSGKVVYNGENQNQIDISRLQPGLYFITVQTDASVFTGRFVKN